MRELRKITLHNNNRHITATSATATSNTRGTAADADAATPSYDSNIRPTFANGEMDVDKG